VPPTDDPVAAAFNVLIGIQAIYYTALIGALAWRLSSRLGVLEFKVNQLWGALMGIEEGK